MRGRGWGGTFKAVRKESERWWLKVGYYCEKCHGRSFQIIILLQVLSRVSPPAQWALSPSSPKNVPLLEKIRTALPQQVKKPTRMFLDPSYLTDRNFSAPSSSTPVRDATPTNHVLAVEGGGQEGVRLEGQLVEEEEEDDQGDSSKEVNAEEKEERERTAKGSLVASSECWQHASWRRQCRRQISVVEPSYFDELERCCNSDPGRFLQYKSLHSSNKIFKIILVWRDANFNLSQYHIKNASTIVL